jgi:hypothetical protein
LVSRLLANARDELASVGVLEHTRSSDTHSVYARRILEIAYCTTYLFGRTHEPKLAIVEVVRRLATTRLSLGYFRRCRRRTIHMTQTRSVNEPGATISSSAWYQLGTVLSEHITVVLDVRHVYGNRKAPPAIATGDNQAANVSCQHKA